MLPYKYENEIPFFKKHDCDIYGMPDYYGYSDYRVIDNEQTYVVDFTMECERKLRPIHRYKRSERFTFILAQLLGLRGDIDTEILYYCKECKSWDDIRKVLKSLNKSRLCNRIPYIMKYLKLEPPIKIEINNLLFNKIEHDFLRVQENFKRINFFLDRKYFPSLRYIACKLLEKHGAKINKNIKFIRTRHKLDALDKIWIWIS